ncbi:hypothetical protein VP01_167g7 [Puccinia sorghi]|uniref:Uncharacterized protein n=1 Tax=Puccinia sorghi TaxID=27349 RepID=A0A0L6VG11_9BASI|nr:hypothetical protein VP01_167g7 [Puccinia sorghi]
MASYLAAILILHRPNLCQHLYPHSLLQSLATPQTLHKRMLNLGKQGGSGGRVSFKVVDQGAEILRKPQRVNFAPGNSLKEYDPDTVVEGPNIKKAEAAVTRPEDRKLSNTVAKLMEFLRRPRSMKPFNSKKYYKSHIIGPGPFDIPIMQERNLLHPLVGMENRDRVVDNFIKEFKMTSTRIEPKAGPEGTLNFLKNKSFKQPSTNVLKNHQQIEKQLRTTLEKDGAEQIQKMTRMIQQVLGESTSTGASAIPNLVKKISAYKSKMLLRDQTKIISYLPEDQRYLTRLIGFFGPKNVLVPVVDEAIQRGHFTREAKWFSKRPNDFIPQLENIQKELGKLVGYNQELELGAARGAPDPKIMATINKLESRLIADLGGRDQLKYALKDIESWDIHKGLMQEMNNPKSTHSLLLQLIEPWGYLRQYKKIPLKQQPYKEFGVIHTTEKANLKLLDTKAAPFALNLIQAQLDTAAKLRRVEQNINDVLTEEALMALTNSLKAQK